MWYEELFEIIEHTFQDTILTFFVVLAMYILISFFEKYISRLLKRKNKLSPLVGAVTGCIPQCGVPIVATELYMNRHLSIGTLVAVYLACSDEAIPIILSNPKEALAAIPLLICKIVIGFVVGFLVDLIITKIKSKKQIDISLNESESISDACCHHNHDHEKHSRLYRHLIDPLIHSLKIFAYIFIINIIFHGAIHIIGEAKIASFLHSNKYINPLLAVIIGAIPNCASSMILTELFIYGGISFGACLAGLCINAGIGLMILLKKKKFYKDALLIFLILFITSITVGYITCIIIGF